MAPGAGGHGAHPSGVGAGSSGGSSSAAAGAGGSGAASGQHHPGRHHEIVSEITPEEVSQQQSPVFFGVIAGLSWEWGCHARAAFSESQKRKSPMLRFSCEL